MSLSFFSRASLAAALARDVRASLADPASLAISLPSGEFGCGRKCIHVVLWAELPAAIIPSFPVYNAEQAEIRTTTLRFYRISCGRRLRLSRCPFYRPGTVWFRCRISLDISLCRTLPGCVATVT